MQRSQAEQGLEAGHGSAVAVVPDQPSLLIAADAQLTLQTPGRDLGVWVLR